MKTNFKICANCKKKVRLCDVCALFSGSLSGASCVTFLCKKCANNKGIMTKMQRINDNKLCIIDGEKSCIT